jgi:hypothetical protein
MGNHIKRFILAPSVQRGAVRTLAVRLREEQRRLTTLTFCSLEDKQPRLEHARLAKQVNARKVEVESALLPEVLVRAADAALGAGNFLFREKDDESLAVCHPNALWLRNTFGVDGLEWLIDNFFEDHASWGTERFYALPGNPPSCDVTLPIHVNMLRPARPARPGEPRECPICGQVIEATNASFKVDMKDNRTAAYSLMEELQKQAG